MQYSEKSFFEQQNEFNDHYFNIDSIFAANERITCKIEITIPKMGHLDSMNDSDDLQEGRQVEFPTWMVKSLLGIGTKLITIETPRYFAANYREIMDADASVVDLHKLCSNFYKFGLEYVALNQSDDILVSHCLFKAFQSRLGSMMDLSLNASSKEGLFLSESLDNSEKIIFMYGHIAALSLVEWESTQSGRIVSSHLVTNLKKRKRLVLNSN